MAKKVYAAFELGFSLAQRFDTSHLWAGKLST